MTFTSKGRPQAVTAVVDQVRDAAPAERPAFMHGFLANWLSDISMASDIGKALGPDYVAVRPDQLVDLFRQSRG